MKTPVSENAQRKPNVAVPIPKWNMRPILLCFRKQLQRSQQNAISNSYHCLHPQAVNLLQNFRGTTIFTSLPTYTLVMIVERPTISQQNPNSKTF